MPASHEPTIFLSDAGDRYFPLCSLSIRLSFSSTLSLPLPIALVAPLVRFKTIFAPTLSHCSSNMASHRQGCRDAQTQKCRSVKSED
mmetsp:Transcript_25799/g.42628  ORF Transcript_25799/g.42628 Transcript_25799/m.42628 type:complete len:87 (-) Transcript_25799:2870-3130(-)